ncbi:MAG TPA: hypothetical protein VGH73_03135 [Thermoanaerobaculia bacterium]
MSRPAAFREPLVPGALWLRWEMPDALLGDGEMRSRMEAESLFAELLAHPPEQRMKALKKARFRKPAFVELLLEKSRDFQLADPERAEALALMAASLTVQLHKPDQDADGALIAVFMARSNCLAGNARRLLGSEADAEIAFGNAAYFLARSAGSCDRAFYCRSLAVLRWEQGRMDEAVSLLFHAARIFAENGAIEEEGTCLALAGLLAMEEGDAERALAPLRKARLTMPAPCRPWLSVRLRLTLALALADLGYLGRARWMRQEAWQLYALQTSPEEQFRAQWLEGRICMRLGAWQESFDLLDGVRAKLTADRLLPESALAALDQALLLAQWKRTPEIEALIQDFATALLDEDGLDIALRGLRSFQRDLAAGKAPQEAAAGIASFLRRTFRFRGFRVEPLPFA